MQQQVVVVLGVYHSKKENAGTCPVPDEKTHRGQGKTENVERAGDREERHIDGEHREVSK